MKKSASQRHPLPLPTGVIPKWTIHEGAQLEALGSALERFLGVQTMQGRRKHDVLSAAEIAVTKGVVPEPAQGALNLLPRRPEASMQHPPGRGARECPDDGEQGALPRAIGSKDRRHLA